MFKWKEIVPKGVRSKKLITKMIRNGKKVIRMSHPINTNAVIGMGFEGFNLGSKMRPTPLRIGMIQ